MIYMLDAEQLNKYVNALLSKSEEAYLMAIEIINKPTINYRTEGFCFFICNAWELLLKAYLINKANDINVINYKDGTNRTIGLDECVEKVFTSTTDKTKNNITLLRNIRNKATHLILPDFDYTLAPFHLAHTFVGMTQLPTFMCNNVMKELNVPKYIEDLHKHLDKVFG